MTPVPGTLACTAVGGLLIRVETEHYRIAPEDARMLIFSGRPAPIIREQVLHTDGIIAGEDAMARQDRSGSTARCDSRLAAGQSLRNPEGFVELRSEGTRR